MIDITFIFKNGLKETVRCDDCVITKNDYTGEIIGYSIKGLEDKNTLYIRMSEVICVISEEVK